MFYCCVCGVSCVAAVLFWVCMPIVGVLCLLVFLLLVGLLLDAGGFSCCFPFDTVVFVVFVCMVVDLVAIVSV